jgi:pimeloyl-ACP methyl ester carboxylesterase
MAAESLLFATILLSDAYNQDMKIVKRFRFLTITFCLFLTVNTVLGQTPPAVPSGKAPIIIIPGLTGSELVNSRTGEEVWFKAKRSKDDDLRLPISANLARNHDDLVPKDILRSIKLAKFLPESEIYERLINALETRGGYKEGQWNTPAKDGFADTFYVFPYDWRRDNVENARLLVRQIDALKRKLGKPNLKFNIIAHSMGGIISRYAAMYGNADLPAGAPKPTWAGAKNFDKIFLLGTPNEGSALALNSLLNGFSYFGGGINLPFIQDIDRFDVFTMPSAFQLLPHDGTLMAYDEDLKPIAFDLYDPATWEKYGWSIWQDADFKKKMSVSEQRNARGYFLAALGRAKRLQTALDANTGDTVPVSFYLIGAECKDTQNGMLLLHNGKKDKWEVRFKSDSFTKSNGEKVTAEQVKPLLMAAGDSIVTKRSLTNATIRANGNKNVLPIVSELYQCETHNKLVTNPEIQDKLFLLLNPMPK